MIILCCLDIIDFQILKKELPSQIYLHNHSEIDCDLIRIFQADMIIIDRRYLEKHLPSLLRFKSITILWGSNMDEPQKILNCIHTGFNYFILPDEMDKLLTHIIFNNCVTEEVPAYTPGNSMGIIGKSKNIESIRTDILRYAPFKDTVTLIGETGTGKEITAKALHISSLRNGPFIAVNCACIPEQLMESELFGSKKGAFTDSRDKIGYFEAAHDGTLFLDEIGELPLSMQVKLLRVLEDSTITPLGCTKSRKVNVRILCATSRDLIEMMENGLFRKDLFYRITTLTLQLAPLRERKKDIPELCRYLLSCKQSNKKIHPDAMMKLLEHSWPGNVRELRSVLRKAEILSGQEEMIEHKHIKYF